jgi:hypothetical protein
MISPDVRELYRIAPEEFIVARDVLVKRLRDEGRDEDAAEVKKLRRPTVAAWALDRLTYEAAEEVDQLLAAGADLARAQRETLSGRDPQALRDGTTRRRDLVARLTQTAAGVLRDAGRSPDPHLEDIRGTLEVASVNEDVAERLRAGTLDRTIQPTAGFGEMSGLHLVSRRDDEPKEAASRRRSAGSGTGDDREDRRRGLESEIRRLRRDRETAEGKAAAAESARARLAEQVASMQTRLESVREKLQNAESLATELRLNAKRAAKAFDAAERKRRGRGG